MGKTSSIRDHANHLQRELNTVGDILPSWVDTSELQVTAKRAKLAREAAVARCMDLTGENSALARIEASIHSAAGPVDDRAVRELKHDAQYVAKQCEVFHLCVEHLSEHSETDTRNNRAETENRSQEEIVWRSERLLTLAKKLSEALSEALAARAAGDGEGKDSAENIDRSTDSSSSGDNA